MSSLTVRISETSHRALRALADHTGESMQTVLAKAIEEYRRRKFLERVNAAFAALRTDPEAWKHEQEERAAWDATLSDGLKRTRYAGARSRRSMVR